MTFADLAALIHHHGGLFYLLTFVWTALEGETFVLFAGLAAQRGMLNVVLLFAAAWFGTFCGDQIFFFVGRKWGHKIVDRFPRLKASVDVSLGWLERHAGAFILSYRFMYGIRNISSVAIGMSHLAWRRFLYWNALASLIWAGAFTGAGYAYGGVISRFQHKHELVLEAGVREIMLSVLGLFVLIVLFRVAMWMVQKHRTRRICAISEASELSKS